MIRHRLNGVILFVIILYCFCTLLSYGGRPQGRGGYQRSSGNRSHSKYHQPHRQDIRVYASTTIYVNRTVNGTLAMLQGNQTAPTSMPHTRPKSQDSMIRIAHIVNFFSCKSCPELFRPLDQAQNITIASMRRATQFSNKSIVTVYVAAYEQDRYIVPEDMVLLSIPLVRSTASEYPNKTPKKALPYADDLLKSLYDSNNTKPFDYVIFTNSDIALQDDFYDRVADLIAEGYDGFAVNRRTLPMEVNGIPLTGNDLDLMYNMTGEKHSGTDCIIFKKDLYPAKFRLGNLFLGFPPVGSVFRDLVQLHSETFHWFKTMDTHKMTFHLGNERLWKDDVKGQRKELHRENVKNGASVRGKYGQ
mmetsp:Transcript_25756/g.42879  ORF Transcript_25756/g.42879 Transcript_25756/m.42879 type:complete len:360 (-) Transcript_25756:162-1241(-)